MRSKCYIVNRMKKSTTTSIVEKASAYLSSQDDVVFAYLFGSHAQGTARLYSDIDIAVYLVDENAAAERKMDILHGLSKALERDTVDLVVLNQAGIVLAYKVMGSRVLIKDGNPPKRHLFESLTMRKYFDFGFFEKHILERRFSNG